MQKRCTYKWYMHIYKKYSLHNKKRHTICILQVTPENVPLKTIWKCPIEYTENFRFPPYLAGTTPSRCWSSWVSSQTSSGERPVCWRSCPGRSCPQIPSPVAAAAVFPCWPSTGTAPQRHFVHSPSIYGCSAAMQPPMKVYRKWKQSLLLALHQIINKKNYMT